MRDFLSESLLDLESVESVQHLYNNKVPNGGFTFLPFLCPFRYKPFNVVRNEDGVIIGVTTGYRDGITQGAKSKIDRVKSFWHSGASTVLGGSRIRFLMGDSDVYACCTIFPKAPALPEIEEFEIVSNKKIWSDIMLYWN